MPFWLWWTLVLSLLFVLVAALYFGVRVHRLGHILGSFECAYRRDIASGWTAGICILGGERLDWYRVVSLRARPSFSWDRADLQIRSLVARGSDPASAVVEAACDYREHRFILAMRRADHTGVVSWLEGAAPRSGSY